MAVQVRLSWPKSGTARHVVEGLLPEGQKYNPASAEQYDTFILPMLRAISVSAHDVRMVMLLRNPADFDAPIMSLDDVRVEHGVPPHLEPVVAVAPRNSGVRSGMNTTPIVETMIVAPGTTPGDWEFVENGDANDYAMMTVAGPDGKKQWVASFSQNGETMPEPQRANARLMAASPNLYSEARRSILYFKAVRKMIATSVPENGGPHPDPSLLANALLYIDNRIAGLSYAVVKAEDVKTKLTAENVRKIVRGSLFETGEPTDDRIEVRGITAAFGFHPIRLEAKRSDVVSMLRCLPDGFFSPHGESFVEACMDRDDVQWGEHPVMDELLCLAMALHLVQVAPRETWPRLPLGLPVFRVLGPKP